MNLTLWDLNMFYVLFSEIDNSGVLAAVPLTALLAGWSMGKKK